MPACPPRQEPAPAVSVLMSVYNGERYLLEAIDSIRAQTFRDFEFIIVDDASDDGSAEIARRCMAQDGRIRLLALERNRGQAAALNHGLGMARGEFIARMDADDVCAPARFQKQVDYLRAHPEIGVLGCAMDVADERLRAHGRWDYPARHAQILFNLLFRGSGFAHPATMMRRQLLVDAGGYDENARFAQDVELWTRLASRARFANLPDTLLTYRRHEQSKSVANEAQMLDKSRQFKRRAMQSVWSGATGPDIDRLITSTRSHPLGWAERRRLRRDLSSFIDALIAANWLGEADRHVLEAAYAESLSRKTPRLWQMFLHWRRYRLGF